MPADVNKALKEKSENNPLHAALLDRARALIKRSKSKMASQYSNWDIHDRVFRGEHIPDSEDRANEQKAKPSKMIVPNTFAQVMTFTSFLFLLYTQNRTFYELGANADDDFSNVTDDSERLLERDCRYNNWNTRLFQLLLDTGRFGLAVLDCSWTKSYTWAKVPQTPISLTSAGISSEIASPSPAFQRFLKYEGNLVRNVSPYRFFPDVSFPIADFQKGEFVAVEEDYTIAQLKDMEANGEVFGIDFIEPLSKSLRDLIGGQVTGSLREVSDQEMSKFDATNKAAIALVTKIQMKIVPASFEFGPDNEKLGEEQFPIIYHFWVANGNRVIRFEPSGYWHGEFSIGVAQFTPDMQRTITDGIAELIYPLQQTISWYVNSHIRSVQRVIGNRLIIDPKVIDTKTLDGEGDIYIKKGMSVPLERAVGQLRTQDVTAGHMQDAEILTKIIETVTGVNGNAMGQYNSGRRSAQESRVVTAGAAGRMKMHGQLIWESALGRVGKQMLSNLRQELSFESFKRIMGDSMSDPNELQQRFQSFKGSPEDIIAGDDFFVFDSTLSSEKGFMAQSLQELLQVVLANPVAAQQLDISPKAMLEEIQLLRGAGNVSRFSLRKRIVQGKEAPPMPAMLPNPGAPVPAVQ